MTDRHNFDLLTKPEAAQRLRVSVRTLERYIEADRLQVLRLPGGLVRIRQTDLEAMLTGEPTK